MIETMDAVEELQKITVGRITYCVVTAIPILVILDLVFDHGQTKEERFRDFLLSWILVFIDVPIVLVGLGVLIRQRYQQQPITFWAIAVFISAIPILVIILSIILKGLAGVHIRPFT